MGSIKIFVYLFFIIGASFAKAQSNGVLNIEHKTSIPGNYSKFYTDNFGNIFAIQNNNIQIKKLSPAGDSLQLSDKLNQYGNIYSIDVSNPLKLLVYYKDFSTALMLDRFLNTVNTIDLRQAGILQANTVASSYDGQIWTYDEQNAQIKKIDANGAVTLTSTDLRNVFPSAPSPSKMVDNNGLLYLYDKNMGWLLFDYYGGFKQKFEYTNWEDAGVTNGILFGRTNDTLWILNPKKLMAESFTTSPAIELGAIKQMNIAQNKIFILNNNGIEVYDIKQ